MGKYKKYRCKKVRGKIALRKNDKKFKRLLTDWAMGCYNYSRQVDKFPLEILLNDNN